MGLSEEVDRDVAAPAHRAPVKGGGISTVALGLAATAKAASPLDPPLRAGVGRYSTPAVVNSMSPGFQVLLIAASVGPYSLRIAK